MALKLYRSVAGHPTITIFLVLLAFLAAGVIFFLSLSAATQKNSIDVRSRAATPEQSPFLNATLQQAVVQNLATIAEVDGSRGVLRERGDEITLLDTREGISRIREQIRDRIATLDELKALVQQHHKAMSEAAVTESITRISEQQTVWQNVLSTIENETDSVRALQYYRPFLQLSRIYGVFEPRERLFVNWAILDYAQTMLQERIEQAETAFRNVGDDADGTVYEQTQVLLEQARIREGEAAKQLADIKQRIFAITTQTYILDSESVVIQVSQLQADMSDLKTYMTSTTQILKIATAQLAGLGTS